VSRFRIGVRWWLGLAFGLVAAATAATVVSVFSHRSQHELASHAQEAAAGAAFVASQQLSRQLAAGVPVARAVRRVATSRRLDLYVYSAAGDLAAGSGGHAPAADAHVVRSATRATRPVVIGGAGSQVTVGLPFHRDGLSALVVRSRQSELPAALRIVQQTAVRAGLIAGLCGLLVGLLLAQLISLRLGRLTDAAEAIRSGDLDAEIGGGFRDEIGSVAAALERMRTELKDSFEQLAHERDRLRLLLERLREGIVTVDRRLVVQLANAEARSIVGGLREGEPLPTGGPLDLSECAAALFGRRHPEQRRLQLEDGRTIALVGIPAHFATDVAILVLADVTEEEQHESGEREFVANAAHELRTPLATIVGAVEMLQSGAKEEPAARDRFLAHVERESERLVRLVRALLVLARAQTRAEQPPTEPVELRPLLEEVAATVRPRPGVALEVDASPELALVTNRDLLHQAVRNLAENAVKHTDSGRISLRAHAFRERVRVEIDDTGAGMTAEARRRVFDRFYRGQDRDADGFGLGLAIVRQTVEALDGRVEVESEPGAGSCFSIVLDGAPAPPEVELAEAV
jgi:signal transduction histidine kinase/HAMP domain-containing protein